MIRCKHCPATTASNESTARVLGWRLFDGPSQTGKALSDVVCPRCAGTVQPEPEAFWTVRCNTCHWESDYDDEDEAPSTAAEAVYLGRGNECEPDVELLAPEPDSKWMGLNAFNRDGTSRLALRGAS